MLQQELILDIISPLNGEHTIQQALDLMDEHKVSHLPYADAKEFYGVISEESCLNIPDSEQKISNANIPVMAAFIKDDKHIFDAIKLISDFKLSLLPVLNAEDKYIGYLDPVEVIQNMGNMLSIATPGSVLVLQINDNDYHLSQVAQIVESGDAKILMSYLTSHPNSTQLEITLKINKSDLSSIIQTFERYDYHVVAKYHQSQGELDLKFRYDNLMKYLNI